jgi:hypothetical protein
MSSANTQLPKNKMIAMKIKPLIVFIILVYHFFEELDTISPEPKAVFGGRMLALITSILN